MPKKEINYNVLSAELDKVLVKLQDPATSLIKQLSYLSEGRQSLKSLRLTSRRQKTLYVRYLERDQRPINDLASNRINNYCNIVCFCATNRRTVFTDSK